jgi:aryl-alcohol dehydrogenase-like predicted oxidoreductase
MSLFNAAPQPNTLLGRHRVLSPTAGIRVSPICLGGMSLTNSWFVIPFHNVLVHFNLLMNFRKEMMGAADEPYDILDTFFSQGGNFIDTANVYQAEESEKVIGQWMQERGNRDQMVIATKYTAGFRAYNREKEPIQTNFTGSSVKSMHVSIEASLKKLKTDYVDILYVHW